MIDVDHSKFDEELPGLLDEIEEILEHGGNHKIDDVLGRLTVREYASEKHDFRLNSADQTYDNRLNDILQPFAQNFKDALTMLSSPPPVEYLMDVDHKIIIAFGSFARLYKGTWKGKQVIMKKFCHVRPRNAVFLIPSDIIHYLTL